MARIRTIKPEFWSDEKLTECSLSARLLFVGLISFADDEGRMEYSPARIRMQVFPCGSVRPSALNEWFGELSERSLIRIYVVEGKKFLDIPNFIKHQRINRPTPSKLPDYSMRTQGAVTEFSVSPTAGMEGNGRELEKEGIKTETPKPPEPGCVSLEQLSIAPQIVPEMLKRYLAHRANGSRHGALTVRGAQAIADLLAEYEPKAQRQMVLIAIARDWGSVYPISHVQELVEKSVLTWSPPDEEGGGNAAA